MAIGDATKEIWCLLVTQYTILMFLAWAWAKQNRITNGWNDSGQIWGDLPFLKFRISQCLLLDDIISILSNFPFYRIPPDWSRPKGISKNFAKHWSFAPIIFEGLRSSWTWASSPSRCPPDLVMWYWNYAATKGVRPIPSLFLPSSPSHTDPCPPGAKCTQEVLFKSVIPLRLFFVHFVWPAEPSDLGLSLASVWPHQGHVGGERLRTTGPPLTCWRHHKMLETLEDERFNTLLLGLCSLLRRCN